MATYYVDCDIGASGNGLTWATAKKTITEGVALANAAGDIVEISGGIYAEEVVIQIADGAAGNYITFQGSGEVGHNDEVIIQKDPCTQYLLDIRRDYIWVEDITLHHAVNPSSAAYSGLIISAASDHAVCVNLRVRNTYGTSISGTNVTLSRCLFAHPVFQNVHLLATSSGIISHCFFGGSTTYQATIWNESTGTWSISDCIVLGTDSSAATISSTGAGGVTNLDHSLVLPSGARPINRLVGVTEGAGNLNLDPSLTSYFASGYALWRIDDGADLTYAEQMAAIVNPLGQKILLAVTQLNLVLQPLWQTRMQALIDAGNEVACHTYTHSDMSITTAFAVTGTGTTPTVAVDRTNDRIRCHDADSGDQDVAGFRAKTLDAIRGEINAMVGFAAGALTATLQPECLGEALAELAPTPCVAPQMLDLDLTEDGTQGYFKVEVFDPKAWLEAQFPGTTVMTFVCPWNRSCAAVCAAIAAAGYTGAGGNKSASLSNLPIFEVPPINGAELKLGASMAANAASLCINTADRPKLVVILSHSAVEMPLADITIFANIIAVAPSVDAIHTFAEIIDEITTSGNWATADGGATWTRTYVDASNYRELVNSPCIGTGAGFGVWIDRSGHPLIYHLDIGAYDTVDWAMWDHLWLIKLLHPTKMVVGG